MITTNENNTKTISVDSMDIISHSDEEEACLLLAMHLASASIFPMVLKTAIELDLLELIKKADMPTSASELAIQLPINNNPDAATMIDRILCLLAAHSILVFSLDDDGVERRYSLGSVCKFLTKNEDGVSIAPVSIMFQDRVFMETWYHLKDAILEGGIPFNRAHGMNAFEYPATDPRYNNIFNQAMSQHSTILMKKILENYQGFEGLKSLADVGGGIGSTLNMIISKYPSIKGINFDLPHVIQNAPSYPGIEHIGGDMFVSVPKADAIFMKWICHDWSDTHCHKLLKNCYEALPDDGKVIIAECILLEEPDCGLSSKLGTTMDVGMLAFNSGGKERTEKEFHALAKQAGFRELHKVFYAYNMWIIEISK